MSSQALQKYKPERDLLCIFAPVPAPVPLVFVFIADDFGATIAADLLVCPAGLDDIGTDRCNSMNKTEYSRVLWLYSRILGIDGDRC